MSSLRDYDRVADRIRQHRQVSTRAVLVVEGPRDSTTLAPMLPDVDIFPAGGRSKALAESETLVALPLEKWACVVDRDFDDAVEQAALGHRAYPYAGADLEAMLVSLGVLETVIINFGSIAKIEAAGGAPVAVSALCSSVQSVAALREANAANSWGLNFKEVPLADKFEKDSLRLRLVPYCTALRATASSPAVSLAELIDIASAGPQGPHAYSGKDVAAAASHALRKQLGTLPRAACAPTVVEAAMRGSSQLHLSRSDWLEGLQELLAS